MKFLLDKQRKVDQVEGIDNSRVQKVDVPDFFENAFSFALHKKLCQFLLCLGKLQGRLACALIADEIGIDKNSLILAKHIHHAIYGLIVPIEGDIIKNVVGANLFDNTFGMKLSCCL